MNRYRVYTGPTLVQCIAERLRASRYVLHVTFEGTMHVYVTAESAHCILAALGRGQGWTFRDIQELPL